LSSVLLADDSCFVRSSMEDILTERGFKVKTVQTATEVIRRLSVEKFDMLVICLDISEYERNELLKTARLMVNNIPAAVVSCTGAVDISMIAGSAEEVALTIGAVMTRNGQNIKKLKVRRSYGRNIVISY